MVECVMDEAGIFVSWVWDRMWPNGHRIFEPIVDAREDGAGHVSARAPMVRVARHLTRLLTASGVLHWKTCSKSLWWKVVHRGQRPSREHSSLRLWW